MATKLGNFPSTHDLVHGLAPDEGNNLFGISAESNHLVRINANNGFVTPVGHLGTLVNSKHGLTWSETMQTLFAVNLDPGECRVALHGQHRERRGNLPSDVDGWHPVQHRGC